MLFARIRNINKDKGRNINTNKDKDRDINTNEDEGRNINKDKGNYSLREYV